MKVEVKPVYQPRIVKPHNMLYKQMGYIQEYQGYKGILVMRAYMSLFALDGSGLRWDWKDEHFAPSFDIELLPPGTVVTITVSQ